MFPTLTNTSSLIASPLAGTLKKVQNPTNKPRQQSNNGVFWRGANGQVYVKGGGGVNSAGAWDGNTSNYWGSRGFTEIADPNAPQTQNIQQQAAVGGGGDWGGGGGAVAAPEPPKLDQAQIDSLYGLLSRYDADRTNAHNRLAQTRDTQLREKDNELKKEKGKYEGKKLSTLQDFAEVSADSDVSTRNTLEGLISSLSTMGMGGSEALTRQILDAANISARKANATQARNNQELDGAWNEFSDVVQNDQAKIRDQYAYEKGETDRQWAQNRQNTLYKIGDVYNAAERTDDRQRYMNQGNNLNSIISNSSFLNPQYKGEAREMATPELGSYLQNMPQYDTSNLGGNSPLMGANSPQNTLAVQATNDSDQELGIKKRTENSLGYGV